MGSYLVRWCPYCQRNTAHQQIFVSGINGQSEGWWCVECSKRLKEEAEKEKSNG